MILFDRYFRCPWWLRVFWCSDDDEPGCFRFCLNYIVVVLVIEWTRLVWLVCVDHICLIMLFKTGLTQCLLISLRNIGQQLDVIVSWAGGGFGVEGSYFSIGLGTSSFFVSFFFLSQYIVLLFCFFLSTIGRL